MVNYAAGSGTSSVVASDVNGDGKIDLAVAARDSNVVSVLLNQGNGTFAPAASYPVGSQPTAVTAADLNGDGKPDLIAAGGDNSPDDTVSVLMNQGNGTFATQTTYVVGWVPQSIVATDLNGDGKPDLATANFRDVNVLFNQGNGTFGAVVTYSTDANPTAVVTSDLNSDGRTDLLVLSGFDSNVSVMLNTCLP